MVGLEIEPEAGGDQGRDGDEGAEPWLGVPGEEEEAFVPEEVVGEESYREDVPGIGAAPGGEREYPGAIPGMENRRKDKCGAERPEHPAFPIPVKKE